MATQDEQKGRWKTAGGNTNPRTGKKAVRGLRIPSWQGIWQRDTGCDLDGFLIIFIKKCSFELSPGKTVPSEIRISNRGTLITWLSTLIDPNPGTP